MNSCVTAILARASASAATSAAIRSLSTRTPLQSKMITGAPLCASWEARRPDVLLDESQSKKLGNAAVAKVGRFTARKSFLHRLLIAANVPRKGLVQLGFEIGDAFGQKVIRHLVLDGAAEDRFRGG